VNILINGMSYDTEFNPELLQVCLGYLEEGDIELFQSLCRLCDVALLYGRSASDLDLIKIALEKVTTDLL
jgi:hypothetical protein